MRHHCSIHPRQNVGVFLNAVIIMYNLMKNILVIRILSLWFPVVIWAVVIFLFSSHPTSSTSEIHWKDFIVKKTAHIVEYAIFCSLVFRALKGSGMTSKKAAVYALGTSVVYGLTDEYHQSLTPGRDPRIRDVGFDTIGSVLSIYTIWILLPKAPKRFRVWAEKLQFSKEG